jgi:hypothetical protein
VKQRPCRAAQLPFFEGFMRKCLQGDGTGAESKSTCPSAWAKLSARWLQSRFSVSNG